MNGIFRRTATIAAVAFAFAALASTGSATTLYAPLYSPDKLVAADVDGNGGLTELVGSAFDIAGASPVAGTWMFTITPDGTHGALAYGFGGGVQGVNIAANGAPSAAQTGIAGPATNVGAASPNGKFMYFGNGDGVKGVGAYSIGADGALTQAPGSPYGPAVAMSEVAMSGDGKHLFASDYSNIYRYDVNPDGSLTLLGSIPMIYNNFFQTSPDGRFLFVVKSPGTGSDRIVSYTIGADGSLTQNGAELMIGDQSTGPLGIAPSGNFIYAADSNLDAVLTVRVLPDGTLATVGAPLAIDDVQSLAVSPDGRFLYGQKDGGSPVAIMRATLGADGRPDAFVPMFNFNSGEPVRIVFSPPQAPTARFTDAPSAKALTMSFDGKTSTIGVGTIGSYNWDFGDGATGSGVALDHKYAKPGVYDVTMTAADTNGCSTAFLYNGQNTLCNGKPTAAVKLKLDTPPWITSLKLSKRTATKKTRLKFKLTEKSRVTIYVQKPVKGRIVGSSCRKQSKSNAKKKKCTLWLRASKSFRANGKSGSNSIAFVGKVGHKALPSGSYRFNAVAKDLGKSVSPVKTATFKIKR